MRGSSDAVAGDIGIWLWEEAVETCWNVSGAAAAVTRSRWKELAMLSLSCSPVR